MDKKLFFLREEVFNKFTNLFIKFDLFIYEYRNIIEYLMRRLVKVEIKIESRKI